MSDSLDRANEEFKKMNALREQSLKIQNELEQGIGNYAEILIKINKTQKDILHIEEQKLAAEKELADYEKKTATKRLRWEKLLNASSKKTRDLAEKKLAVLNEELNIRKANAKILGIQVQKEKESLDNLKQTVKESNRLKAIARSTGSFVKAWGFDKLKTLGVFDMDREIRNAARSMGVGRKQSKAFSLNLQKAGESTVYMGVSTKELAKMQRGYSEEVGRATMLTKDGLEAMAEMSMGTGLGEQFAIGMASAMDKFGGSVETSRDLVKETVDYAQGMGVNSAKAAEMTSKSLKLVQRFKFKGGAEGLAKMATEALKLRIDMDAMAGVADKVFRPEEAIKFAATLGTMGGKFAQLADPMQLMFKARNDMAGFNKDMAKASAEFVEFNKETGTFEVKGGAALDRMREIGTITGLGAEKLQEMAVAQKRIETIGAVTPISFSDEDDALISGLAEIQKGGEMTVMVDGMVKSVENLTKHDLMMLREKDKSLRETAEQARTAEDTLNDIKTSFVQLLIPVAEALKDDFAEPLKNLVNNTEFKDTIRSLVSGIASLVGTVTKFVIENPIKSIGIAVAGLGLFKGLQWFANGVSLGLGFNSVAGGTGNGSLLQNLTKRFGGKQLGGRLFGAAKGASGVGLKGAAGSIGAIGGGVLSGGLAGYNEYQENKEMGMGGQENIGRTAAKGISAGLGAWGGAAAGAAIGSVVPVIGTVIGGLIGGAIGAWGGSAIGEGIGDAAYGDENRASGSMKKVKVQDAAIKLGDVQFDDRDNFLLASTSKNQLNKSVETMAGKSSGVGSGNSVMTHKFDKLDINITINGVGISDEMAKAIVNSDTIANGLNIKLQEAISKNMNGGIRRVERTA